MGMAAYNKSRNTVNTAVVPNLYGIGTYVHYALKKYLLKMQKDRLTVSGKH